MRKIAPVEVPILDLFVQRWSPLAFDERPVPTDALRRLFEAARWSPSSNNEQPWRFLVGTRDGDAETYAKLLDCLVPANQLWASTAPVLMLNMGSTTFARNGMANPYALYDTGQATAFLTVEAAALGISLHQMGGFDREKARGIFGIPDEYVLGAAIALGYEGAPDRLTDEKYRERHLNPARVRQPLAEIVLTGGEGAFGAPSPLFDIPREENTQNV
jgi:nitroreductase